MVASALYHLGKILIKQALRKKSLRDTHSMSNTQCRTGTSSHIKQCNSSIGKCLSRNLLYDNMHEIEALGYAHAYIVWSIVS